MAELATIARPYAEALYQVAVKDAAGSIAEQVAALEKVCAHAQVLEFAENPKAKPADVLAVLEGAAKMKFVPAVNNLLSAMLAAKRVRVLPEVARQFSRLLNASKGVTQAVVESAFPMDAAQLAEIQPALEKRFGRQLSLTVAVKPELIGGVRVVVGDEVLDTSVKNRLTGMRAALAA